MKSIKSSDVIEYIGCPRKAYFNRIKNAFVEQAKLYLRIFQNANKLIIVDKDGNILGEIEK